MSTSRAEMQARFQFLRGFAQRSETIRSYRECFSLSAEWCHGRNICPLPGTTADCVRYLGEKSHLTGNSTALYTGSIRWAHRECGYPDPTDNQALRDIIAQRIKERAPKRRRPVPLADLYGMVDATGNEPIDIRDRAVLLVAFFGSLERHEVAGSELCDLQIEAAGAALCVRHHGFTRRVFSDANADSRYCPIAALEAWLRFRGAQPDYIFRAFKGNSQTLGGQMRAVSFDFMMRKACQRIEVASRTYCFDSLRMGLGMEGVRQNVRALSLGRHMHLSAKAVERYQKRYGSASGFRRDFRRVK